jgi:uncharacterized cofD-like protein
MESSKKSIVVIGGGTGTHTLLKGLKKYADRIDIKAIVTMADSGGSTGRLRDEFGYLPVGDARSALAALAEEYEGSDDVLRKLFLYRFDKGEGLNGHTFGNLFLVALTDILGSEAKAIQVAGQILRTCGEVIPVTEDNVHLIAQYSTGAVAENEHDIDVCARAPHDARILELTLSGNARISERASEVLRSADLVVLGPGDLYTSILANCIVRGVGEILRDLQVPIVYISNLMSRSGQTEGMGTDAYLEEIRRYTGRLPTHILLNNAPFPEALVAHYATEYEYPVIHTYTGNDVQVISDDFLAREVVITQRGDSLKRSLIRHDPDRLAHELVVLAKL